MGASVAWHGSGSKQGSRSIESTDAAIWFSRAPQSGTSTSRPSPWPHSRSAWAFPTRASSLSRERARPGRTSAARRACCLRQIAFSSSPTPSMRTERRDTLVARTRASAGGFLRQALRLRSTHSGVSRSPQTSSGPSFGTSCSTAVVLWRTLPAARRHAHFRSIRVDCRPLRNGRGGAGFGSHRRGAVPSWTSLSGGTRGLSRDILVTGAHRASRLGGRGRWPPGAPGSSPHASPRPREIARILRIPRIRFP